MRCILGRIWAESSLSCREDVGGYAYQPAYQPADLKSILVCRCCIRWFKGDEKLVLRALDRDTGWAPQLPACMYMKWGCNDIQDIRVWPLNLWIMHESDTAMCSSYSSNWDRLHHDRRRQTNFTLLEEPVQSWHHNVSCLCQRKERRQMAVWSSSAVRCQ